MGLTDWTALTGSASTSDVRRGPTYGLGSAVGSACFAASSATTATRGWGLYTNRAGHAPVAPGKGTIAFGAIRAGLAGPVSAPPAEPFLYCCLQPDPMPPLSGPVAKLSRSAYLLGLSASGRLALVKGLLEEGIPDVAPGEQGVLVRSDEAFAPGTWLHLQLVLAVNTHGDVVLTVRRSDLEAHSIELPSWEPVPGLDRFIDDVTGFTSGTRPLGPASGGYGGFGAVHRGVRTLASFDAMAFQRGT
jgi:hypothetical protein